VSVCGLCIAALSFSLHHHTIIAPSQQLHHVAPTTTAASPTPSHLLRGSIAILTAICILAVDFNTFPRALAKTEEFGTSLMDAGVGVVAFAGGLTSRTARWRGLSATTPPPTSQRSFTAILFRITPLILLAVARSISHAALHLPLHVSEYGVEWNFFATLAVLAIVDDFFLIPLMCALPIRTLPIRGRAILITSMAIVMMVMLDVILLSYDSTSFAQWLLHGERGSSFFQRNREGIVSLLGFMTLHLMGTASGLVGANESSRVAIACAVSCVILLSMTGYFWNTNNSLFHNTSHADGFPVSRRLANTPYIAWISIITLTSLCLWRLVTLIVTLFATTMMSHHPQTLNISVLIEAAGNFPGPVFLFANILTGIANTSADIIWGGALDAPLIAAFCVCSLQAVAVCIFALFLKNLTSTSRTDTKKKTLIILPLQYLVALSFLSINYTYYITLALH
jgi:phosphatidylinositol glycan class W